ncbi:methylated-DNA--[protein]-cysteine S-methyltransferase [Sandaracinus amylolyticus]|uniref:methylated-DNA--[protein]-cysteine S-methyltransferase n=1 Tax=Sandaracinus amylolyticus TaxID=927083 RepID=A0A0F6SFD1_9BACT|nr:methylated-DNA--[protein]-cysteine S-methyltransferase [Sandaracinus amylolyticus]AKF06734.1 Methylated-DNA--protein-cysteine methyltransferase [Sandaracinus amylolyticus]
MLDLAHLGRLHLAWSAHGLVWIEQLALDVDHDARVRWLPEVPRDASASDVPARFADPLRAFDAGAPIDPATLDVDLRGTEFQNRVWSALRAVGRGQVRTYAGLAADAGSPRAMRAVGMAMSRNPIPIVVPCHRIIAQGSRIGGYTGGLPRKRVLLALEGVGIDGDRVIGSQLSLL